MLLLDGVFWYESLVIPLLVQKVWESSGSNVYQLVENSWDDRFSFDFKVEASFLGQSQDLFEHKSCGPLKDGVDTRVNES